MERQVIDKHCPRCQGTMFYIDALDGPFLQCLQCGNIRYLEIVKTRTPVKHPARAHAAH